MIFRIRDWDKHYETERTRRCKRMSGVFVPSKLGSGFYELVEDHENGPAHYAVWIILLLQASASEVRGDLRRLCPPSGPLFDGALDYDEWLDAVSAKLTRTTRLPKAIVAEAITRLIHDIGWLDLDLSGPDGAEPDQLGPNGAEPDPAGQIGTLRKEKKRREENNTASAETAKWFEEFFWPKYPRKVGKGAALKACLKAIETPEDRVTALRKIEHDAPEMLSREEQYRPHAATWFNQGRWADPIEASPAAESSPDDLPSYARNKF